MTCLQKACTGIAHKVWIGAGFAQNAAHAFEHVGVDVSGAIAKIGGNTAFDLRAVHQAALVVHLFDNPTMTGNGYALAWRWRVDDGTELGGFAAHRVLLVFLEHSVELE